MSESRASGFRGRGQAPARQTPDAEEAFGCPETEEAGTGDPGVSLFTEQ